MPNSQTRHKSCCPRHYVCKARVESDAAFGRRSLLVLSAFSFFRPYGRAEDECSRSAAPSGGRVGAPASVVGIRDVSSTDPLRPVKVEVPRHILYVSGRRPRGKMVLVTFAETKVTRRTGDRQGCRKVEQCRSNYRAGAPLVYRRRRRHFWHARDHRYQSYSKGDTWRLNFSISPRLVSQ